MLVNHLVVHARLSVQLLKVQAETSLCHEQEHPSTQAVNSDRAC